MTNAAMESTVGPRRARSRRAVRRWRRRAAYAVVLLMLASATPTAAVTPPGSLAVPDPPDWGVWEGLESMQANETAALGGVEVVLDAEGMLENVTVLDYTRQPATGPYRLLDSKPPPVQVLDLIPTIETSPYENLTNFFDILLGQPLKMLVLVKSGDHVNWVETRLMLLMRPRIRTDGVIQLETLQPWESVNIDNDTTTGDASGDDVRLRIGPTVFTREWDITVLPFNLTWLVQGGLYVEIERLDDSSAGLPLETTFIKPFRYSNVNYTWFVEYKIPQLPQRAELSITAESIDLSKQRGDFLQRLLNAITNIGNLSLNGTDLGRIAGPYLIAHDASDYVQSVQASLGYLRLESDDVTGEVELDESSWLTVRVSKSDRFDNAPRRFSLWLDSPSFNRSFDHLNWTAEWPSKLEIEYFDDRENYTQARGLFEDAPPSLRLKIDNATEEVGEVSKIHLTLSEPIRLLRFDEWEFMGGDRRSYLHSHVELEDLPTELWLNGTLDVGGKAFDPLDPDRDVTNIIPQLMDGAMTRLASKLFTIGRTVRSLPQNVLDMPDRKGYTTLELPVAGEYLGRLELWLTSDHYVLVDEGIDFFAFYNDTVTPVGKMVQTGFSGRLMDIKSFHATFADRKQVVLDSRYNREFRALFIDEKNAANASLWFSNIPHNISLELMDQEMVYMGDGSVDRIQYTSEIGEQYMRLVMEGVPGGLHIHQGDDRTGVSALLGAIDSVDLQITDGRVRRMLGDHLMIEMDPRGTTAASAHITDLSDLVLDRVPVNHVTLRAGGEPFAVYIDDRGKGLHLRAKLDPLPSTVESDMSDILGLGEIGIPSLNELTSVLDFATVIYAISDLGDDIIKALGEVSTTIVGGIGTFSSDFSFNFTGDATMDLAATISHSGPVPVDPVPWAHGATVNLVPYGDDVLLESKVFLTGLAPVGRVSLSADERTTLLSLGLMGFKPRYDHLVLSLEGASLIEGSGGKDIWLYVSDLRSPMDLDLTLDLLADLTIGGTSSGSVAIAASQGMGPIHMRVRTRDDQISTVELLVSSLPSKAVVDFVYTTAISLNLTLSSTVDYVFLKLSRDLRHGLAPSSTVVLHDVPTLVGLFAGNEGTFDMDSTSPVHNLPRVSLATNEPGLDLLVDLDGRAMGNKADLHLDVRNAHDLSMARSGDEYRMSASRLDFIHLRVSNLLYSETTWVDRVDLAIEDLRRATMKVHMVFGVFPIIDIDDLTAGGIQATLVGRAVVGDEARKASITLFEVPASLSGLPRSHDNGLAIQEAERAHRILVPAPMSTLLGTLL